MLISGLSLVVGGIQWAVNLLIPLPSKIWLAHLWKAPWSAWVIVSLSFLAFAQLKIWRDEYEARRLDSYQHGRELEGEAQRLDLATETHRVEIESFRRDSAIAEGSLRSSLTEARSRIAKPAIALSFKDVAYREVETTLEIGGEDMSVMQLEPPESEWTEFIATGIGSDAFAVHMNRIDIGNLWIQSRTPLQRLASGQSRRLEYSVHYPNGDINLSFRGHLRNLLQRTLEESGKTFLDIPLSVSYLDANGTAYESAVVLTYALEYSEMPAKVTIKPLPRGNPSTAGCAG